MVVTRHQSRCQQTRDRGGHRCASKFEEVLMATKAEYFCSGMNPDWKRKFKRDLVIDIKSCHPTTTDDDTDDTNRTRKRSGLLRLVKKDSIPVTFLTETSIYGMKYIVQERRHWAERVFWILAFVLGLLSSVYLIYGLWKRYSKTPVVVTFDVNDVNTNSIPFPAVTICNLNLFSKQMVANLTRDVNNLGDLEAKKKLRIIGGLCATQKTFLKEFGLAYNKEEQFSWTNESDDVGRPSDTGILDFLTEVPCNKLIRKCKFSGKSWGNCSEIFKPILTSYGRCCTFNMLPLPSLLKNPKNTLNSSWYDNPMLGSRAREHWNQSEMDFWAKWDYDKEDIHISPNSSRPYRQKRAGRHYGLSIGLDLNSSDLMCPVADSQGLLFTLHSPVEMPHVKEYSSAVTMGKEMFVEIVADVTKANDDIRNFPREKRKCVFGSERNIRLYRPYTRGNCIDECAARKIVTKCHCAALHLPNFRIESKSVNFCFNISEQSCVDLILTNLQDTMDEDCPNCDPLCEEIKYNHQTTMANLKPVPQLLRRKNKDYTRGNANRSIALLHIFFGGERTVPKLRKTLYGIEDLIASTGGILGLCLRFSVLSGIELIYFFTLRPFCKHCRLRGNAEKEMNSRGTMLKDLGMSRMRPAWGSPKGPIRNVNM